MVTEEGEYTPNATLVRDHFRWRVGTRVFVSEVRPNETVVVHFPQEGGSGASCWVLPTSCVKMDVPKG